MDMIASVLLILGLLISHEATIGFDSLDKLLGQCNFFHNGNISCSFKRLRNEDIFPFLKGTFIKNVDVAWAASCLFHPYVELPDTTFSDMPNVHKLQISGCVKRNYTSKTFQGLDQLYSYYHYAQPLGDYFTTFDPDWLDQLTGLRNLSLIGLNARSFHKGHFCRLQYLNNLVLKNNLIQSSADLGIEWDESDIQCLPNLTHLDISGNPMSTLNVSFSKDIPNLKVLTAKNCSISQIIGLDSAAMMGLQELNLSNNSLSLFCVDNPEKCINSSLSHLDLHNNHLTDILPGLFMCTRNLKYLNMAGNLLNETTLLDAGIQHLTGLEYLNLDGNNISSHLLTMFNNVNMTGLHEFSCNSCGMKTVHFQYLNRLKMLHTLDLSNNEITKFTIMTLGNLKYVRLVNNNITYIDISFLPKLEVLDLSKNGIQHIHHQAFLLVGLQRLNLDFNNISDPGGFIPHLGHLSQLHLRGNGITKLYIMNTMSVEWIDLSMNQISYIEPGFFALRSLTFVNLTYNELHHVGNPSSFQALGLRRPEVYLEGNYLLCDCNTLVLKISNDDRAFKEFVKTRDMSWPHNGINGMDHGLEVLENTATAIPYIQVPDLYTVNCDYYPYLHKSSLVSLEITDFLCPYNTSYQDGCTCCPDVNCSCCSVCYNGCQCYRGYKNNRNVMTCRSTNLSSVPQDFPNFVTEMILSSNNIKTVEERALDKASVKHLKGLDLSDNNIHFIDDRAFKNVPSLEWLKLHNNNLKVLETSILDFIPSLLNLSLHDNPWKCDCAFGPKFKGFIEQNHEIIFKPFSINCTYNTSNGIFTPSEKSTKQRWDHSITRRKPILDMDTEFYICRNRTIHKTIEHRYHFSLVASMAAVFVLTAMITLLMYKKRLLIRVWAYNTCGTRCHKEDNDNKDKPYDVFLAYALADEEIAVFDILPTLEFGPKSYVVYLESRDWIAGKLLTDNIIESVQRSKRTVLLVTENFFRSKWAQYEFQVAHMQVLEDRQLRLILVLTDISLKAHMESDMKLYLKTGTYLVYGEKYFWEKLRYYLADDPRGTRQESAGRPPRPESRCHEWRKPGVSTISQA